MATTRSARQAASDHERLARRLKELRRREGLGGLDAASRSGLSQSTISRIETCRIKPTPEHVDRLCAVYNATPSERRELLELAKSVEEESKRARVVLPRGAAQLQATFAKMDAKAAVRRVFSATLVPGVLQTPDYIRVIFAGTPDVEETVQARMARRRQLSRRNARQQYIALMTEGALRWQMGSPQVMVEQIDLIVEATRSARLRVGVIPWTRPVRVAITHGFNIYDSAAVLVGTEVQSVPYTDPDDVQLYLDTFAELEKAAVYGEEARQHLARIGHDYRLLL